MNIFGGFNKIFIKNNTADGLYMKFERLFYFIFFNFFYSYKLLLI